MGPAQTAYPGYDWGTIAVCLTNPDADLLVQVAGVCAVGAFTFFASLIVWTVMRRTVGIRLKRHHEHTGGDLAEVGMRAYNLG